MAILTLTSADAGKTIPVSGSLDWEIVGTDAAETIEVAAGTVATVKAGGGKDVIKLLGGAADYSVALEGSNAVFTHTVTGKKVFVPMTTAGDSVAFGNGAAVDLKIDAGAFKLGTQTLTTTSAAVTGATGTATGGSTGGSTAGQAFSLTASDVTITEPAQVTAGTNTTANMTFTVNLSAAQATDTVVNYATSTAAGDLATANADYTTTNGSVTIAKGATSATFTVPVIGDGIFDGTVANPTGKETFTVTLSSPTTAFATKTVKGIINDLQTNALPTQTIPTTGANILMGAAGNIGTGITVADADNTNVTVVLTAANGLLSVGNGGGLTAQNNLRTLTLTGTKTQINDTLATLTYSSDRTIAGVDTITMETTDPLGGKSTTGTITVNVNSGGTFTAGGTDAFTGTAGNDYYTGTQANITGGDTLAAGGGTADTLSITAVNGVALSQTAAFTGLEVVNVTTTAGSAQSASLDVSKAGTDVKTINFTDGDGATTTTTDDDSFAVTNLNTGSTVTINNIVSTLDLSQAATGSTVTLALAGGVKATSMTSGANPATTFNIQSNGSAANEITSATTAFGATTNVTITGSAALKLTNGDAAGPLTINGSTATGALTIDDSTSTTASTVITGGLGADSITGPGTVASTLSGNEGNDTLTGGTGADTINGGAGDDSIVGGTGADSMTGGLGKDTYSVNELGDKVVVAPGDTGTVAAGTADVVNGIVEGVKIDLSAYYTGAVSTFIADGNLAVATSGASSTLRDVYVDTTKKAIVIEMDATGTATQEIYIGAASSATVANVGGVLTFGAVPMTSYISGNKVVVEGQAPLSTATIDVDLGKAIPQTGNSNGTLGTLGTTMNNVTGATTSSNSVDVSKAVGAAGVNIIGSSLSDIIVAGTLATVITAGAGNDTITGGTAADSITGGAGIDTINITGNTGVTTIVFNDGGAGAGINAAVNRDVVIGFSTVNDIIQLDTTQTSAATSVGTNASVQAVGAAGAVAFNTAVNDVLALNFDMGGASSVLGSDLTGAALLANLGGALTVAADGGVGYIVAYDNGNAYLYTATDTVDAGNLDVAAGEIALIGVFNGVAVGGLAAANFTIGA